MRTPSCISAYQHDDCAHECVILPERSLSGRRLSLPLSLMQAPKVTGPTYGTPSFGAVTRARLVDTASTTDPENSRSTSTSPARPPRIPNIEPGVETLQSAPTSQPTPSSPRPTTAYASSTSSSPNRISLEKRSKDRDPELGGLEFEPLTFRRWAMEDVAPLALVPTLVAQALGAGVLDATTYADFATFASNQTGNAIVLTLAAVGTIRHLALLTGVSFAGFIAGAFVFGHLGNLVGPRKRIWLISSTSFQCLCLIIAAIFVSPAGPRKTQVGASAEWSVLFLFALMSGVQVVMARQSNCQTIPTSPMTSSLVDFVADHYLFRGWNNPKARPRNERFMYMLAMIGGSFLGAVLHKYTASWVVIMVTILLKCVSGVLVAFASPEN